MLSQRTWFIVHFLLGFDSALRNHIVIVEKGNRIDCDYIDSRNCIRGFTSILRNVCIFGV